MPSELLRQPVLKDDSFLADVQGRAGQRDGFRLWFLGQSGFLLQHQGRHLLFDPYLSDSLTRKYAGTDKPHERLTARVVAPERLHFIDVLTSSHNHTDHLDAETLLPILGSRPGVRLVIPEANRAFVAGRLGIDPQLPVGLDAGLAVTLEGFQISGVAAAHENLDRDSEGRHHYLGYLVRFGSWTVYHAGDTVLYPGMVEQLRTESVDVALLPINGRDPKRGVAGNLSCAETAWLAREIGAKLLIPCHWDMFRFNSASPQQLVQEADRLQVPSLVLPPGGRLDHM